MFDSAKYADFLGARSAFPSEFNPSLVISELAAYCQAINYAMRSELPRRVAATITGFLENGFG